MKQLLIIFTLLFSVAHAQQKVTVKAGGGSSASGITLEKLYATIDSLAGTIPANAVTTPYAVTYTATPTFNYNNSTVQEMTLTGNVTAITLSNIPDGKTMYIKFKQDATGSRTVSGWGANGKLIGGALTLTTTGNAEDIVGIKRMGSNYYITYGKDYK